LVQPEPASGKDGDGYPGKPDLGHHIRVSPATAYAAKGMGAAKAGNPEYESEGKSEYYGPPGRGKGKNRNQKTQSTGAMADFPRNIVGNFQVIKHIGNPQPDQDRPYHYYRVWEFSYHFFLVVGKV
jgi:hypothetical protein